MCAERTRCTALAFGLASLLWTAPAHAALCGDTTGDGYFRIGDVRKSLQLAVESGYDRRGDVAAPFGNKLTAGDALASLRASVEKRVPPCHGASATRAVVTTAPLDFDGSGGFAVVDIATRKFAYRAGSIRNDSVVRVPSGVPVVINREGWNSLQLLNVDLAALPTIKACSVSDGFASNPQDVLLVSPQKGYATPYKGKELFVINPAVLMDPELDPACKGIITNRIDLSQFDSDGVPQMDQMVLVGTDLFVTLQLLDDKDALLGPKQNGIVAVIDTVSDTIKGSITLSFRNPFAATKGLPYDEFQRLFFTGGPGKIGSTADALDDGAIEAVDPVTMQSAGVLLTGADIHANIFDFVVAGTGRIFAIVAGEKSNSVVDIDLGNRSVRTLLSSSDRESSENLQAMITDIEMTELGELWVAYRGRTKSDPSGLRIFRVSDGVSDGTEHEDTAGRPIWLGQAPFTLGFID